MVWGLRESLLARTRRGVWKCGVTPGWCTRRDMARVERPQGSGFTRTRRGRRPTGGDRNPRACSMRRCGISQQQTQLNHHLLADHPQIILGDRLGCCRGFYRAQAEPGNNLDDTASAVGHAHTAAFVTPGAALTPHGAPLPAESAWSAWLCSWPVGASSERSVEQRVMGGADINSGCCKQAL